METIKKNDEAVCLGAISIPFNALFKHCIGPITWERLRRRCLFSWKQMIYLPLLKALGWNDRRNPWMGPNGNEPFKMCMMCRAVGIRGDYEGCLPYHPVFTRREGLILYAVDWRASELTEQIDNPALHSWASIYQETIDRESLLKNNHSQRHSKNTPQQQLELFCKESNEVFFLNTHVNHLIFLCQLTLE